MTSTPEPMPPYNQGNDPNQGSNPYGGQQAPYGGQPAYGQQPYGGQPGYGGAPAKPKNGLGIAALILGIIAILSAITVVGGVLFGIVAIVLGFIGRSRAKKGEATNGGMAMAGIVTGAIGLILSIVVVVAGTALLNSLGFGDLTSCLEEAGQDQAAVQQCQVDFQENVEDFGN